MRVKLEWDCAPWLCRAGEAGSYLVTARRLIHGETIRAAEFVSLIVPLGSEENKIRLMKVVKKLEYRHIYGATSAYRAPLIERDLDGVPAHKDWPNDY